MLLLNNNDVAKVLDMPTCLGALDSVFQELAVGDAAGMGRIDLYVPSGQTPAPYYRWAVMAGGSKKDGYVCARMLSDMVSWPHEHGLQRGNKYARAPGTYCGMLFLFSAKDATPVAMINDGILQHARVGGGAGLGVKYLARKESRVLGMIGSGGMARHYLDAFRLVRPIRKVKVYSPNAENLRAYVREMSERHGIEVEPAASAREAVRGVDIAACCTSASKPVFSKDWLEPGMHVTDVQASEIPYGFVRAVDIAVRAGDATAKVAPLPPEADYAHGSFLGYIAGQPEERAIVPRVVPPPEVLDMPRLADLIAGKIAGRTADSQTTYFFNLGAIGAQFEAVAAAVYEKARAQGLGTEIPTDWFLQDIRD
jgi:ornithine cyclodeaminase/alanine dehydrogenase-like protein (mu-crystallin family)